VIRFSTARTGDARRLRRTDLDLAEVEPELRGPRRQRDGDRDRVVAIDGFLDEADDLAVVDLREAQIAGLLQRRVARAGAG
jgi:hypothetical protein